MRLTVIGSINLDFVATAPRLPRAGETLTGATLARHPGGKGANHSAMPEHLSARIETPLILQLELPTRDEVEESLA